jgi:hypothetical protein
VEKDVDSGVAVKEQSLAKDHTGKNKAIEEEDLLFGVSQKKAVQGSSAKDDFDFLDEIMS